MRCRFIHFILICNGKAIHLFSIISFIHWFNYNSYIKTKHSITMTSSSIMNWPETTNTGFPLLPSRNWIDSIRTIDSVYYVISGYSFWVLSVMKNFPPSGQSINCRMFLHHHCRFVAIGFIQHFDNFFFNSALKLWMNKRGKRGMEIEP